MTDLTPSLVELNGVTCQYEAFPVLESIHFQLQRGQFMGILGPSGAGKTTLLKVVLGLVQPVRGEVRIAGTPLRRRPAPRVAYVPQVDTVDWNFPITVEQAVLMGRVRDTRLLPWPSRTERALAHTLMERLGISLFAHRHIRDLSGGQQQRVFLARALIAQPDLLVLDEPTAGVDMHTQEDIFHLLAALNREGLTILMTTHDLNAAAAHIPSVMFLNRTVIAQGAPHDVFTPELLNATYQGDMLVIRQGDLIFVFERPHGHTLTDLYPLFHTHENAAHGHSETL